MMSERMELETTKRVVCPHGNPMELRIETQIVDRTYETTVTESICKECLRELAVDLLSRALKRSSDG